MRKVLGTLAFVVLIGNSAFAAEHDPSVWSARAAVSHEHSSENLAKLAATLMTGTPTAAEKDEARQAANEALALDSKNRVAQRVLDQIEHPEKEREAAETEATPLWLKITYGLGYWIAGFAVLLIAGVILSAVAMRAARKPPQDIADNASGMSTIVRRIYQGVLFLSCAFYYLSIPIVITLVIAAGGGIIYAFFALGRIPVKLVIGVVVVVGATVISMIKSLFVRPSDEEPGKKLELAKHPRLHKLLKDVAKRIGTRPVTNVYLTPGTEVAVMQRGKGKRERCLILGIAALDGLMIRPFKAILGHEYGHFTNRDTAGGAFAISVRNSLHATAYALATSGVARWYNPAWLFLNGFNRVFLRISEGASRVQEVLADRWATFTYGADAFEAGLRHVIERSVRFDAHARAALNEVIKQKQPLTNLYTYQPAEAAKETDLAKAVHEALNRKVSAYDSHPAAAERFKIVRALPVCPRRPEADDELAAWTLFDNPTELQHAMTVQVRANVSANYGVSVNG